MIRFQCWVKHDTLDAWFLPVAKALLEALAHEALLLAMDGSAARQACIASMASVVYHPLPINIIVVDY
ncbi:MAG: hypothetical protein NVS2B7_01210 [Herpetosiphon sp.]